MQTRIAFNSGEFSPEMAYRSDMDQYGRACETLENWEVSQMGGLKRRRGMRALTKAMSTQSRLIPYIYSYADDDSQRYLIELGENAVRVLTYEGEELARFESVIVDSLEGKSIRESVNYIPRQCRFKQVNNLLIITALDTRPMVLKRKNSGEWVFEPWEFKQQMWRYDYEQRDYPIILTSRQERIIVDTGITNRNQLVFFYDVDFDENETEVPETISLGQMLRASVWTESQEAKEAMSNLLQDFRQIDANEKGAAPYQVFAKPVDEAVKYFICTADWNDGYSYVPSLDSPVNYPNNFIQAESSEGFEEIEPVYSIHDVKPGSIIFKGTKIAIKSGYWEYYTCIKSWENTLSVSDLENKEYFIKGIPIGNALPCRGEWSFYCSGVWFGSYEVRRNYESSELSSEWERRGESFSRIEAASNTIISGSEADEICYLRLFLTRSKRMSDEATIEGVSKGFPQDSCGNRLIVNPYKHDVILKWWWNHRYNSPPPQKVWKCVSKVTLPYAFLEKGIKVRDWSFSAFNEEYGYPLICEMYNKRLVFASTYAQPQTVWMSRMDDLNNFATSGSTETAAMALTLNTTSQNPICWLHSQSYRLILGTSEAEYSISAGQSQGGISNSNAQIEDHSHVGSDGIAILTLNDAALFVERGAGRVYSLQYSFQIDGYTSQDISVFAPHIAAEHDGIIEMSSIRKPDMVALFVLGDGQLGLCTYNKLHEINAWHRWVTYGKVLSVCGMPNGKHDDKIFLIVQRGENTWIEVVDSDNSYSDNGYDYDSLLVVNALMDYREGFFGKKCSVPNYICLGADFKIENDNIHISDDGGNTWLLPVHQGDGILHKGWNKQYTPSGFKYEVKPSVKVTGNQGIHILGLRD